MSPLMDLFTEVAMLVPEPLGECTTITTLHEFPSLGPIVVQKFGESLCLSLKGGWMYARVGTDGEVIFGYVKDVIKKESVKEVERVR